MVSRLRLNCGYGGERWAMSGENDEERDHARGREEPSADVVIVMAIEMVAGSWGEPTL